MAKKIEPAVANDSDSSPTVRPVRLHISPRDRQTQATAIAGVRVFGVKAILDCAGSNYFMRPQAV